ncbi:hypothetical protein FH063_003124 [Azospirillum argentinense]|uniref:Uncharacterized protein n=1 Tax=Azospirillum argentinense TaxID=2970906 RepID=A0A5B0KMN1_9PROT|nr:hypothetical protein FH063_003124 [Azospirillum argentinense]
MRVEPDVLQNHSVVFVFADGLLRAHEQTVAPFRWYEISKFAV